MSPASNLVCLGLCLKDWYFAPVEEISISISSRSIDCKQNQSKYIDVRSDDEGPRSAKDMKFSQQSNEVECLGAQGEVGSVHLQPLPVSTPLDFRLLQG